MDIKKMFVVFIVKAVLLVSIGCTSNQSNKIEIYVSAPSSLTDVLQEAESIFEATYEHIELIMNYASSGTIQIQLEQGAPADLFISAASEQMNELANENLIQAESIINLLSNRMVVIAPLDTDHTMNEIGDLLNPEFQKIAIGEPEIVPAGGYAKEIFTYYHLWDNASGKFIFTKDVRQTLAYVETGNVDAGFVYSTDAARSVKSRILFIPEENSYTTILYPMGITSTTKYKEETKELYDFLMSKRIQQIFEKHGFSVLVS